MEIPAATLRHYVDATFPTFAVNGVADRLSGFHHRFLAGHDLLTDVFTTAKDHGFRESLNHAGHILLTDFPTKYGIPIPGFSATGLGGWLTGTLGIDAGWLSVSLFDSAVGIAIVADSSINLIAALQGKLVMDSVWTFYQTFGKGAVEIALSSYTQNPFFLVGGVENLLAGVSAVYNKITLPIIDPVLFFGSGLISAFAGYALGRGLFGQSEKEALKTALINGAVTAIFTISPFCAAGAMVGLLACSLGQYLGKYRNEKTLQAGINNTSLAAFIAEIKAHDPDVDRLLALADKNMILPELKGLPDSPNLLPEPPYKLPKGGNNLFDLTLGLPESPYKLPGDAARRTVPVLQSNALPIWRDFPLWPYRTN